MGFFSKARKRISKLIPKEVRPFIPYAAAMIPGGQLGLGAFATKNPAMYKALMAGGTRFATDDEADLKDIARTGIFAAAPTAISQGAGNMASNYASKGTDSGMFKFLKGVEKVGAPSGPMANAKMIGAQGTTDAAIKQVELNEDALAKYNAEMAAQGINDKAGRRAAIRAIYANTGTWDMDEVDGMLDTYGYRTGGRVGYKDSHKKGKLVSMKDLISMSDDDYEEFDDSLTYAKKGYDMLYPEIENQPIRELRLAEGGPVDALMERVKELQEEGLDFASAMAQAQKEMGASRKAEGGSIDALMERVKELQEEGLDFASAMAQAQKEMGASGKSIGGIMDVNENVNIETPRGDVDVDVNSMESIKGQTAGPDWYQQRLEHLEFLGYNYETAGEIAYDTDRYMEVIEMDIGPGPGEGDDYARGGRVGLENGGGIMDIPIQDLAEDFEITFGRKAESLDELKDYYRRKYEFNGDTSMIEGSGEIMAASGGLMNLGGREMDLRGGGFVPMGKKERADDVPARLSKNEFVMTADAVRAAGGGSIQKGADLMHDQMKQLEAQA